MIRILLPFSLVISCAVSTFAQSDSIYYLDNRGKDALLAPRIGVGAGFFTYLGDVKDNNLNHPFTSSWGFEGRSSANISRYFDIDLNIIYGDITVNERTTTRNLNFKSELFIGGVGVTYNFNHLYKKPGIVQPFISVGVAFIHFDSKTDLKDANGNEYHYWSDGSIMNVAEDSEMANQAVSLQRDYTFETDLRKQDNDGLGKYDLFTFSIPVSLGLDFKMGRKMSGRLSSSFYYTFTDLIDDFTWRGNGARQGNKANDMFLYTSLSVAYSIGVKSGYTKTEKSNYFEEFDFYALSLADADADGVNDFDDMCAKTPEGAVVDENGCPVDTDRDIVEDFRDKEEFTSVDKIANLEGVGLTDEMMLQSYSDSVGTNRAKMNSIYPSGILEIQPKAFAQSKANSQLTAAPEVASSKTESAVKENTSNLNENSTTAPNKTDAARLSEMMNSIAQNANKVTETSILMDEIAKEIFKGTAKEASNVDEVYNAAYRVYGKMVDDGRIDSKTELNISRNSNTGDLIPAVYKSVDFNDDGLLTADEVLRSIEESVDGNSNLSAGQVYGLIDFYKENMEDARVVDFGGTSAVYIKGKLNILENYKDDGLTDNERFLVKKFQSVDYSGDGKLTPDEVNRAIAEFKSGKSKYTTSDINDLIDLFFED